MYLKTQVIAGHHTFKRDISWRAKGSNICYTKRGCGYRDLHALYTVDLYCLMKIGTRAGDSEILVPSQ